MLLKEKREKPLARMNWLVLNGHVGQSVWPDRNFDDLALEVSLRNKEVAKQGSPSGSENRGLMGAGLPGTVVESV